MSAAVAIDHSTNVHISQHLVIYAKCAEQTIDGVKGACYNSSSFGNSRWRKSRILGQLLKKGIFS
jgi:hypothetical protein